MTSVKIRIIMDIVLKALEGGERYSIASLTKKINENILKTLTGNEIPEKVHRSSVEKALKLVRISQSAPKVHFDYEGIWMEKSRDQDYGIHDDRDIGPNYKPRSPSKPPA